MSDRKGSGLTYKGIVTQLREQSAEQYDEQLRGVGAKAKLRGDLVAGFRDGMSAMIQHLVQMGVIVVADDPKAGG